MLRKLRDNELIFQNLPADLAVSAVGKTACFAGCGTAGLCNNGVKRAVLCYFVVADAAFIGDGKGNRKRIVNGGLYRRKIGP